MRKILHFVLFPGLLGIISASSSTWAAATPLSLHELYQTGLSRSETLALEREELVQAQEVRGQAKGSFLPSLDVVGTYFRQELSMNPLGQSVSPPTQRQWRLTGRQFIFQGTSEYFFLSQANRTVQAAEKSVSAAHQTFYLEVSSLYFSLLRKERELFHARNEAKLYADQVRELKERVRIGRSRASELLSVEAAGAQVSATVRTLESEAYTLRTQLKSLVGVADLEVKEDVPFQKEPLASLEQYLEWSKTSPTLQAALLTRDASEKAIGVARGAHFPTVDVSGNYYLHREGLNRATNWDVLATLTVPIFAGGTTQSAVREAASRFRQSEIEAGRTVRTTRDEVIGLHQTLAAAENELKALQNARDLAQKSYQRIVRDFRYGLSNNLELIQAMRTLQETENAYDRARLTRMQDRIRLEVAVGRLPGA